jgi:hypothetical protein
VKSFLNQQKQKTQILNPMDNSNKNTNNTHNDSINNTQNNAQNDVKNDIKDNSENSNLYERNFPPKIKDVDVYKASDLQMYEESLLCTKFGEKAGKWLYRC